MSCQRVQQQIALKLDEQLSPGEWPKALAHIESCRRCGAHYEFMRNMHAGLRGMAKPVVPAALTARLRVTASHEQARLMVRANLSARLHNWAATIRLTFDNLMRPFAVPVTGGVFYSLLMFSLLLPNLMFHRTAGYEEPLAALSDYSVLAGSEGVIVGANDRFGLRPGNATISGNEVSLVLLIDERGRVQDYYLSGGELTDDMKSLILLSRFNPATIDGQPTRGLKQVVFQRSRRLRS